jgi:hypothetical protein
MNNIELRLIAERNWREENLLISRNIRVKRPTRKSVWDVMNSFPEILSMELFYKKQTLKN